MIGSVTVDIMKIQRQQHVLVVHHDNIVRNDRLVVVPVHHDSSQIHLSVDVLMLAVRHPRLVLHMDYLTVHREVVLKHILNRMDVQIH